MYDRYCRRNADTPTFEKFNRDHFTCLPSNRVVYDEYKRVLVGAQRATGLPVTRRLPSLFKRLSSSEKTTITTPTVQIRSQNNSFNSQLPPLDSVMKMNIRAPSCIRSELPVIVPAVAPVGWTRESYSAAISANKSVLLHEKSGHMVHLVPAVKSDDSFESMAVKLTKSTWDSLLGKSMEPLKMRDGSELDLSTVSLEEGDLAEFIQKRKKKKDGPHFIRFSRI